MKEQPKIDRPIGSRLEVAVFLCGAIVMIYEINGSRILAPHIGTSTYIWTSLIGVILAALSIGYWLGGKIADLRPRVVILASAIFVAGGLVSLTILIKGVLLELIASINSGLEIKAVLSSLFLFAPASVALGFVLPFAVKLRMIELVDSGKTVGKLYALSTIGSIAGTFVAGFFLIPFVGSSRTMYFLAGALFAVSILLSPFVVNRTKISWLLIFFVGIVSMEAIAWYQWRTNGLLDIDTEYARLTLFRGADPKTGRPIQAISNDPYFAQSAMYLDGDDLVFEYNRHFHLVGLFNKEIRRSLMIGGAGYSFPRDYLLVYPDAKIDVVEIDPAMTEIARTHFRLVDNDRLKIIHEDARVFLNAQPVGDYDVIFMDAFGTLFSVPYHLTTVEAMRQVHRLLKSDGVMAMNVGSAITGSGSRFLHAELATLRSIFEDVRIIKVNPNVSDSAMQNLVLIASKTRLDLKIDPHDHELANLMLNEITVPTSPDVAILTDDLAPVEYYNSFAQNSYSR